LKGEVPIKEFIPIVSALGVDIFAHVSNSISFFNSPFSAHRDLKAVDIYSNKAEFGEEALCPVDGVIKAIREYPSPNIYPSKSPLPEYLILIKCSDNPKVYTKVLHVCPSVSINHIVHVGDAIGTLSRSGYLPFWVNPHMHVELRNPQDAIRANGAYPLQILSVKRRKKNSPKSMSGNDLIGIVTCVRAHYAIVRPKTDIWTTIRGFSGLKICVGNRIGVLDCGLPYIGYGGVLINEEVKRSDPLYLAGTKIGEVTETSNDVAKFEANPLKVVVNDYEYRGISSKLHFGNEGEIKLVPIRMGRINTSVNNTITISLKTDMNINKK